MPQYETFRNELRARGLSVCKVGLMCNINPSGLYTALNGRSDFWPGWRRRIAEALEMDENALFPEYKDEKKEVSQND